MTPIRQLDAAALACDVPDHGLRRGDVGTAVLVHGEREGFEVEFVTLDGHTASIVTLGVGQVRPVTRRNLTHTRELQAVSAPVRAAKP